MSRPILRRWVGRCAYKGMKEFYLGTVEAESEMDAVTKLQTLWSELSPHPCPSFIVAIPGMLVMLAEKEEDS